MEPASPVLDADALSRQVVGSGTEALDEIARTFGQDVLDEGGALDRKRLAQIVFADEQARQRLNAITHRRVRALARARFAELEASGEPLGCYEAALLFENGLADAFRPVVVVSASMATCIARVMARDGCAESEARARLLAQLPLKDKVKRADFVIDNDGSLQLTRSRTDAVLEAVCAALGVDPTRYRLPE